MPGSHMLSLDWRGVGLPDSILGFVREGLEADDRVLWIAPFPSVERVHALLQDNGVDVTRHVAEGRLLLRPRYEAPTLGRTFEAGVALAALRAEIFDAAARGSGTLRLVQDFYGGEREPFAPDELRAFEAGVEALTSRHALLVLCVYDPGRATAEETVTAIEEHAHILEQGRPAANPFHPTAEADDEEDALRRLELFLRYREGRMATRRHAALVRLLRGIVVQAGQATTRDGAVELSLRELCRFTGWPLGHAFLSDPESGRMRPSGVWYVADRSRYASFVESASAHPPAEGEGLVARVLSSGKPAWVSDIGRDPRIPFAALAQDAGLDSAIALPVSVGGKMLAVLEFFASGHADPDPDQMAVLQYVAMALARVLDFLRAEGELRLLGSAVANVRDAIVITTAGKADGPPTIRYANEAFSRMTGYAEAEVLGRGFDLLTGPKTDPGLLGALYRKLASGEAATTEIVAYHRDGSDFLLEWSASPIREADGSTPYFVSIQRDITGERIAEQALRRADHDPLTGLVTRDVLVERLRRAIERSEDRRDRRYALLFVDLDGFKAVNDEQGHVFGDRVLKSIAQRVQQTVRPGDTVARFGGDEFVVLLDHVSEISDVVIVTRRIQESVGAPLAIRGRAVDIQASVGVALSDSGYRDPEHVIREADAAMYAAKRKGRGRAEFADPDIYKEVLSALDLRRDLWRALEREELRLHFQPLMDLETNHVMGFEALVRWQHPERGLLAPAHFIPLAEETGFIVPMGRWILREACRVAEAWPAGEAAAPPALSVNLSVPELASAGLVEAVRGALEETGLDGRRLFIELTETVFSDTPIPLRQRLAELRELGIQVCIDDFGTGYSSLGRLHRLPVDKLKIDRTFVRHLGEAPGNAEIIRTILALAGNLGLDVVAEGVETGPQLERLKGMACRYGQGFLFARPMPPERVGMVLSRDGNGANGRSRIH